MVSCWTIPLLLLLVLLGMPYTSPRLGLPATTSVSWMIRCDPRDFWNRHTTPIEGDRILVGGRFSTSLVNGEFVLRIIPSRFSLPLSFIALFSSSISFLMLRSSFSTLVESSPEVLSHLLAWEFNSSSFWFSPVRRHSAFWDSIVFRSSLFWRVSSSTLAKKA